MKRILINATQAEELRVAMVNGQLLYDLDIEVPSREQKKSNIYKGVITRVEPSLEAAFVDYGAERHGFLPFKEISRDYFPEKLRNQEGKVSIKDAVKVDQEIIVQVEKEERGNKGAALTSFISLAGRFLVAMPQNPRAGGVSRRIEGEDREQIRTVMSEVEMPKGMGVIARTAGVGRTTEEMQWDLDYLAQVWEAIKNAADERSAPFLIYQESDIVIRALRDHYKSDVGEVLIDSRPAYERAHEFMSMVMPNALHKLKFFEEKKPLFNRFQIENQIESAFVRTVNLPAGGAIVIDHTEALTSIDVNSARATKGGDIEETALNTNLEAADEIARQLRVRDLGGLLVIDFIDMMKNKNQRDVETRLRRAVQDDRARVQIGRISRFGLLEMSRQRLRPSIGESSQIVCPRCQGQGTIRDIESLSLAVLRLLEEEALKENTGRILARLPFECATYLLNEKRDKVGDIEKRCAVNCVVVPDPNLETPHFKIERIRDNDTHRHESSYKSSYELTSEETPLYTPENKAQAAPPAQAAVQLVAPSAPKPTTQPAPAPTQAKEGGLISKVITALFGSGEKEKSEEQESKESASSSSRKRPDNRRGGNANRGRNRSSQGQKGKKPQAARTAEGSSPGNTKDDKQSAAGGEGNESRPARAKSRGGRSRGGRSRNTNRKASDNKPQQSTDAAQSDQTHTEKAAGQDSPSQADNKTARGNQKPRGRGGNRSRGAKPRKQTEGENPSQSGDNSAVSAGQSSPPVEKPAAKPTENPENRPTDSKASENAPPKPAAPSGDKDKTTARPTPKPVDAQAPAAPPAQQAGSGATPKPAPAERPPKAHSDAQSGAQSAQSTAQPGAAAQEKPREATKTEQPAAPREQKESTPKSEATAPAKATQTPASGNKANSTPPA